MLSIPLGPLALAAAPVLLLLCAWLAAWVAARLARGSAADAAAADAARGAVTRAVVAGLVVARLAYVALNADAYAAQPWAMLDLRDGGWQPGAGWAAGLAVLAWQVLRAPALRRPLAAGATLGAAVWWTAAAVLGASADRPLPALAFTRLDDGTPTDLRQAAQGRPLVVNLWASWCGPCRREMPVLAAAQQREPRIGFVFVNQGESAATVRAYLASLGRPLHGVLLDPGSTLGPAVGSRGLPTTLFVDSRGRVVDAHFGLLNAAALQSRLRRLQPGP
jgi:thiol-disulfide isomerase/thioredoxin